jgi:hypothetical protein
LKSLGLDAGPAATGVDAGAVAAAAGVTFTKKNRVVGSTWDETETTDSTFNMTKPKVLSVSESSKRTCHFEVLAAESGSKITKVKVSFKENTKVETQDGKQKTTTNPTQNNAYIAEFKDGKIVATDENRKKIGSREERAVKGAVEDWLGKADPVMKAVPGIPVKIGDDQSAIGEIVRDLIAEGDDKVDMTGVSAKLTSTGTTGTAPTATFTVTANASTKTEGRTLTLNLTGAVVLRTDTGHLVSVNFAGPATVSGGGLEMAGPIKHSVVITE